MTAPPLTAERLAAIVVRHERDQRCYFDDPKAGLTLGAHVFCHADRAELLAALDASRAECERLRSLAAAAERHVLAIEGDEQGNLSMERTDITRKYLMTAVYEWRAGSREGGG